MVMAAVVSDSLSPPQAECGMTGTNALQLAPSMLILAVLCIPIEMMNSEAASITPPTASEGTSGTSDSGAADGGTLRSLLGGAAVLAALLARRVAKQMISHPHLFEEVRGGVA